MKNISRIVVGVTLIAGVTVAAYKLGRHINLKAVGFTRIPFTATVHENGFRPNEIGPAHSEYYVVGVRSDGSEATVFRREGPDAKWFESRVVLNLTDRVRVTVEPLTQSLTTYPISARGVLFYQSVKTTECTRALGAEKSTLLGYDVVKLHQVLAGGITRDAWEALRLGCFPLKEVLTLNSGYRSVREVVFLHEGPPPAEFFQLPAGYQEHSPSEVADEFARRYPGQLPFPPQTSVALDKPYFAARTEPH